MKRLILLFNILLVPVWMLAQVVVNAKVDNMQLLVGEQTKLSLEVVCDANQHVQLPLFQNRQEVLPDVEVVKVLSTDTTFLNNGNRMQLKQEYLITAWDSALYYLPPLPVMVDTVMYESKSLALKVHTVDVDTLDYNKYYPVKDVLPLPYSYQDWKMVVIYSVVDVALLVCLVVLLIALVTGKPLMRIVRRKPKEPAHQVALREIGRIKEERVWAQENSKAYYTQLTDTLRTYIQDRYGFNAMDMTSSEIVARLMQEDNKTDLDELRNLFQTADLVKFAKHVTQINENDANLMTALEYVQQTKREFDPKELKLQTEETPQQKRNRMSKAILLVAAILTGCGVLAAVAWVGYRVHLLIM